MKYTPGRLYNKARYRQEKDYTGLRIGNMTPTDLDGFMEIHNNAYVFYEIKYRNHKMPYGQKLAYEHLAVDLAKAGKKAVVLVIEHNVDDTNDIIPVADCIVRDVLYGCEGYWRKPKYGLTAREALDAFVA